MVCFICIYTSKQNKTLFVEEISRFLSHIPSTYNNYIIAGDLNINMFDPKCKLIIHFFDPKEVYISNLGKSDLLLF